MNCEYYVTSQDDYVDYFSFDEVANESNNTQQIRFFVLAQTFIKFKISESMTNYIWKEPKAIPRNDLVYSSEDQGFQERILTPPPSQRKSINFEFGKFNTLGNIVLLKNIIFVSIKLSDWQEERRGYKHK